MWLQWMHGVEVEKQMDKDTDRRIWSFMDNIVVQDLKETLVCIYHRLFTWPFSFELKCSLKCLFSGSRLLSSEFYFCLVWPLAT